MMAASVIRTGIAGSNIDSTPAIPSSQHSSSMHDPFSVSPKSSSGPSSTTLNSSDVVNYNEDLGGISRSNDQISSITPAGKKLAVSSVQGPAASLVPSNTSILHEDETDIALSQLKELEVAIEVRKVTRVDGRKTRWIEYRRDKKKDSPKRKNKSKRQINTTVKVVHKKANLKGLKPVKKFRKIGDENHSLKNVKIKPKIDPITSIKSEEELPKLSNNNNIDNTNNNNIKKSKKVETNMKVEVSGPVISSLRTNNVLETMKQQFLQGTVDVPEHTSNGIKEKLVKKYPKTTNGTTTNHVNNESLKRKPGRPKKAYAKVRTPKIHSVTVKTEESPILSQSSVTETTISNTSIETVAVPKKIELSQSTTDFYSRRNFLTKGLREVRKSESGSESGGSSPVKDGSPSNLSPSPQTCLSPIPPLNPIVSELSNSSSVSLKSIKCPLISAAAKALATGLKKPKLSNDLASKKKKIMKKISKKENINFINKTNGHKPISNGSSKKGLVFNKFLDKPPFKKRGRGRPRSQRTDEPVKWLKKISTVIVDVHNTMNGEPQTVIPVQNPIVLRKKKSSPPKSLKLSPSKPSVKYPISELPESDEKSDCKNTNIDSSNLNSNKQKEPISPAVEIVSNPLSSRSSSPLTSRKLANTQSASNINKIPETGNNDSTNTNLDTNLNDESVKENDVPESSPLSHPTVKKNNLTDTVDEVKNSLQDGNDNKSSAENQVPNSKSQKIKEMKLGGTRKSTGNYPTKIVAHETKKQNAIDAKRQTNIQSYMKAYSFKESSSKLIEPMKMNEVIKIEDNESRSEDSLKTPDIVPFTTPLNSETKEPASKSPISDSSKVVSSKSPISDSSKVVSSKTPISDSPKVVSSKTLISDSPKVVSSKTPISNSPKVVSSKTPISDSPKVVSSKTPISDSPKVVSSKTLISDSPKVVSSKTPISNSPKVVSSKTPISDSSKVVSSKTPISDSPKVVSSKTPKKTPEKVKNKSLNAVIQKLYSPSSKKLSEISQISEIKEEKEEETSLPTRTVTENLSCNTLEDTIEGQSTISNDTIIKEDFNDTTESHLHQDNVEIMQAEEKNVQEQSVDNNICNGNNNNNSDNHSNNNNNNNNNNTPIDKAAIVSKPKEKVPRFLKQLFQDEGVQNMLRSVNEEPSPNIEGASAIETGSHKLRPKRANENYISDSPEPDDSLFLLSSKRKKRGTEVDNLFLDEGTLNLLTSIDTVARRPSLIDDAASDSSHASSSKSLNIPSKSNKIQPENQSVDTLKRKINTTTISGTNVTVGKVIQPPEAKKPKLDIVAPNSEPSPITTTILPVPDVEKLSSVHQGNMEAVKIKKKPGRPSLPIPLKQKTKAQLVFQLKRQLHNLGIPNENLTISQMKELIVKAKLEKNRANKLVHQMNIKTGEQEKLPSKSDQSILHTSVNSVNSNSTIYRESTPNMNKISKPSALSGGINTYSPHVASNATSIIRKPKPLTGHGERLQIKCSAGSSSSVTSRKSFSAAPQHTEITSLVRSLEPPPTRDGRGRPRGPGEGIRQSQRSSVRQSEGNYNFRDISLRRFNNFMQIILTPSTTKMKNSLNSRVLRELCEALSSLRRDENVRMVLLTATGSTFCQGIDLTSLQHPNHDTRKKNAENLARGIKDFLRALVQFPKMIVAGVNGNAMGLGVTMLPLFDMVFATDKAEFFLPYSKLGQVPEGGATYTFPMYYGKLQSNKLFLGQKITASQAERMGLVSESIWPATFQEELLPKVAQLATQPTGGMEGTKALMNHHHITKLELSVESECRVLLQHWTSQSFPNLCKRFLENSEIQFQKPVNLPL